MDFVNQAFKHDKEQKAPQDKMIKLIMMQGARPSSSTFFKENDNYYDVQMLKEDDKVSIAITFLKDHML